MRVCCALRFMQRREGEKYSEEVWSNRRGEEVLLVPIILYFGSLYYLVIIRLEFSCVVIHPIDKV